MGKVGGGLSSTRKKKATENSCVVEHCPPGICEGAVETIAERFPWKLGMIGEGNEKAHKAITHQSLIKDEKRRVPIKKKGGAHG